MTDEQKSHQDAVGGASAHHAEAASYGYRAPEKVNGHTGMNGHNGMNGRVEPAGPSQPQSGRSTGTCKNWAKGYGFISRDDGQGDVFVHQTQIRKQGFRSLQIGEKVEFDIETKEDGRKQAVNVTGPNGADVIGQERPPQSFGGRGGGGYSRGGRGGGGYPRVGRGGGYQQGGFQASPYGGQPNFGQGTYPFIQQPYAYGQATSGFGQSAPYPQPGFGQPPAQYGQPPAQYGQPNAQYGAMAAYAQANSAPQGADPTKAKSPQGTYGQRSGYDPTGGRGGQPGAAVDYSQAGTE